MVYLKSFLVGIGGAVGAVILWLIAALVLPIFLPYLAGRIRGTGGVSSGSVGSGSILLVALVGFILAFTWTWRRQEIS